MPSPAASDRDSYTHRVPPASRLIPGLSFERPGGVRKKAQSVRWDRRFWDEAEQPKAPPASTVAHNAASLWQAIVPTPADSKHRLQLLNQVAADFFLATFFLEMISAVLQRSGMVAASNSRLGLNLLFGALLTLLGYSEGLYEVDIPYEMEVVIVGKALAWTTALSIAVLYTQGPTAVQIALTGTPFLYFALVGWRNWKHQRTTKGVPYKNVLIVGAGKQGRQLAADLSCEGSRYGVCGFLDDHEALLGDVLGRTADLERIARAEFADEIILAGIPPEVARLIIRQAHQNRLDVKMVAEPPGFDPPLAIEHCGAATLLTIHEEAIPSASLLAKRTVDLVISACVLTLTSPLLVTIALLIKLDSPGAVFYRAPRIGKKGRQFLCYKFRTMCADADRRKDQLRQENEREGATFKIAGDPRITRLGRLLRRYSLDELPQLLNVLRGEMSLVGPRPHPLDDCSRYRLADLRRLDVVPGLTGLWQVTARSDPSFERNMALDLEYIERWTLWFDLRILCRTAWVVIQGTGA